MKCPSCQSENLETRKFCRECGTKNNDGAVYCVNCSAKIGVVKGRRVDGEECFSEFTPIRIQAGKSALFLSVVDLQKPCRTR